MAVRKTPADLPVEIEDEADEAVKAFEALRRAIDKRGTATAVELKTIRKGVEALFDQVETLQARPDYAGDLAELKKYLAFVVKVLNDSPIVKEGVGVFERAGEGLVRTAAQTLDQKAQRFDSAAFTLERITQGIRDQRAQRVQLAIAAGFGLVAGVVILLLLPRLLPFDADSHVAAAVMGKSRWNAGAAIMQAAQPDGWKAVIENAQLGQDNADVLARCRQAAAKAGQAQKCVVKVSPGNAR
jgi:hypothetical protein